MEFETTNFPGKSGKYTRLWVPGGGLIFKAYDVNSAYQDCDVFVSVAKLKEHSAVGVTMAMKNLFGVPPTNIYGQNAGIDEPSKQPGGGRSMLHNGDRQPSKTLCLRSTPRLRANPGIA